MCSEATRLPWRNGRIFDGFLLSATGNANASLEPLVIEIKLGPIN
jgi:hypothetical protein